MFGFQARMTCAPGLSGLEPRLEPVRKAALCGYARVRFGHLVWLPLVFDLFVVFAWFGIGSIGHS